MPIQHIDWQKGQPPEEIEAQERDLRITFGLAEGKARDQKEVEKKRNQRAKEQGAPMISPGTPVSEPLYAWGEDIEEPNQEQLAQERQREIITNHKLGVLLGLPKDLELEREIRKSEYVQSVLDAKKELE